MVKFSNEALKIDQILFVPNPMRFDAFEIRQIRQRMAPACSLSKITQTVLAIF
jgi:hypothetical protein